GLPLFFFGVFVFSLLFLRCSGGSCNVVPNVTVRAQFSQATLPKGRGYLNGGVAGIIVAKDFKGNFVAYDRCSPVNPEQKNAVVFSSDGLSAIDPVSGAEWYLDQGFPSKLAECPLKPYYVNMVNEG